MIQLSRINGREFYLNAELVEQIAATPDTVITLLSGKTVMVAETVDVVVNRLIRYRQQVYSSKAKLLKNSIEVEKTENT